MGWDDFVEELKKKRILWDLPSKDNLYKSLPHEAREKINKQASSATSKEIQNHWMAVCSDDLINNYDAGFIADQVGLAAKKENADFDKIIEDHAEGKGDRINMRQYISLLAFDEEELITPWGEDDRLL